MAKRTTSTGRLRLTSAQLLAEIRRRQRRAATLQRRRDRLAGRVAQMDEQIRMMGGNVTRTPGANTGRRRASNNVTLPEALKPVLKGKTMSVTEAAAAVQAAGYKTYAKAFRIQVNMALSNHPKLFKRVGRGQYTAK